MATDWQLTAKSVVEVGCVLLMIGAPIGLIIYARGNDRPYLGQQVIQFLAITEIIPAIVILGLEAVLDKAAAGTLIAGVAGYVLGGISDNKPSSKPSSDTTKTSRTT